MPDPLKIYKALADETRLRLMRLVSRGALNVNEIIDILHMGQSRVSRHLKILAEAGLVRGRREGTWIYYESSSGDSGGGNNGGNGSLVSETLGHLRRHEHAVAHYDEDLRSLGAVVEGRRERTRTFFDSVRDPQEDLEHQGLDADLYRHLALSLLPVHSVAVLDMGTGPGPLLTGLLGRADQVIAVDSSATMLDLARQTAGAEASRCDFRLGDLEHLPVADGEVDAAVVCMVLHHLSNPPDALSEAGRVLRAGGHIAVVDLYQHRDESLRERLADLWLGFEPETVKGWLEELDFRVTATDVVGEPHSLQLITLQGQKP